MFQFGIENLLVSIGIALTIFVLGTLFILFFNGRQLAKNTKQLNDSLTTASALLPPQLKNILRLYIHNVAKHGVDSEEAKLAKFGLDNDGLVCIYGGNELNLLKEQINIVDETWAKIIQTRR